MHEGAIVKSLFDIAVQIKIDEELTKVDKITIVIGKFHQIVEEVMMMQFEFMKAEFPGFESAELEMFEKDVIVECLECSKTSKLTEPVFYCMNCHSPDTKIISGNELYIEKIEGLKD